MTTRIDSGHQDKCPICGAVADLEPSAAGDSVCPRCGTLVWHVKNLLSNSLNRPSHDFKFDSKMDEIFEMDSLDYAEHVLLLEEDLGIEIPDDPKSLGLFTFEDFLKYFWDHGGDDLLDKLKHADES